MKRRWFTLILIAVFLTAVGVVDAEDTDDYTFDSQDNAKVIVKLKKNVVLEGQERKANTRTKVFSAKEMVKYNAKQRRAFKSSNGFAAEVSRSGLEQLLNDPNVEKVYPDREVHATLTDSVPLINATAAAAITVNGKNVTGANHAVCVIDTGINYTHSDLGNCTSSEFTAGSCSKVVGGYDLVNNDNDPYDDNGHGTHVAGIVAAHGAPKGVAPDAKIVSMKVLNSAGSGQSSTITSAIEWCTYNATKYNITAISMSLGTTTLFNSSCDDSDSAMAAAINDAIAKNITVIASTGNSGDSTAIASPACIKNTTAVGSTTKSDEISSFSNTNSITDLLAPGSSITASCISGGTCVKSGTSMSAPHVAGAIALIQQYRKEEEFTLTPGQTETALKNTGKNITDTRNNIIFPRIDVWSAIASVESTKPLLTVASPANGSTLTNGTVGLNLTATDNIAVEECTLTNSTGGNVTITNCANTTFNGTRGYQNITLTIMDRGGNFNSTQLFFTVNLPPTITLIQPENSTYGNKTNISLAFTAADEDISLTWYNIDNGENITITGNTTFNTNKSGHVLSLFANDTLNQLSTAQVYFSVDAAGPNVTFVAPTPNNETFNGTDIVTINITLDENASSAVLEIDSLNQSMSGEVKNWFLTKDLGQGKHTFRIHVNDTLNNSAISITRFVLINTTRDETAFFEQINSTNAKSSATVRVLRDGEAVPLSNISAAQNYTLELNLSGILVKIADFKWLEANTSGIVNVTENITTAAVRGNFSSEGGALNKTVWVEMNHFLTANFTPAVIFDKAYKIFFYINGSRDAPTSTRITQSCNADITNRPCYMLGDKNSSAYLLTFSGAAAGEDIESPTLSVISPAAGANLASETVALDYMARDNVGIDRCFYSLNNGANTTVANCANTTINAAQGANTLHMYANDTTGNINRSIVTFTVTIAGGGGGGSSGGGGGGGSSAKKTAGTSASNDEQGSVTEEREESEETVLATPGCTYSFDAVLPVISLVTEHSFTGKIRYTGNCAVPKVTIDISDELKDEIDLSSYFIEHVEAGEEIEISIIREGGIRKKLPEFITGSAIRDLTTLAIDNLEATKTLQGDLVVEAIVNDEAVFKESYRMEVKVFTIEEVTQPMITAGSILGLCAILGVAALVGAIRRRRKLRRS